MDLKLKGKTALVTGASQGLGFAVADLLAQEGANVAINSRSSGKITHAAKEIEQNTQTEILPLPGDIASPEVPQQIIQQIINKWGNLDILVTNAGGPPPGDFESFDDVAWHAAIELSFTSNVRLIRAALPFLKKSNAASVLTVTSISVKQPISGLILSNSIRGATIGLTKSLSLELGNQGIRFNSILPGWTKTGRVSQLLSNRAEKNNTSIEIEEQKVTTDIPLGRMATPEEFANAAVFLVSPAAAYINGLMLHIDGGLYKGTL